MVEHPGDVFDPVGLFGHPQDQVVVLGPVEPGPHPPHLFQQDAPHAGDVTGVHGAHERVGRPVGFEEGHEEGARLVDLVFVAVEEVRIARRDPLGQREQAVGRQLVVVVQEHHVIAACDLQGAVGRFGDAAVFRAQGRPDARIGQAGVAQVAQIAAGVLARAGVVHQDQLPAVVPLRFDRLHQLVQVDRIDVVDGRDDGEPDLRIDRRHAGRQIGRAAGRPVAIAFRLQRKLIAPPILRRVRRTVEQPVGEGVGAGGASFGPAVAKVMGQRIGDPAKVRIDRQIGRPVKFLRRGAGLRRTVSQIMA